MDAKGFMLPSLPQGEAIDLVKLFVEAFPGRKVEVKDPRGFWYIVTVWDPMTGVSKMVLYVDKLDKGVV